MGHNKNEKRTIMKKIIVATGNEGKMKEFRQILQGEDIIFSSLKDENLQDRKSVV